MFTFIIEPRVCRRTRFLTVAALLRQWRLMARTHVAIIGAPLDLGQDRRGVDMGPSALRVANLNARVASLGYEVEDCGNIAVEQKEANPEGEPHAKYLLHIATACNLLAQRVEGALAKGHVPVVLGGD